jgi:ADP-heptose:LPS heptosyltransferase
MGHGADGEKRKSLSGEPTSVTRAFTRKLPPGLKQAIRQALYLPISPTAFMATVSVLRWLKILRSSNPATDAAVRRILVAYPYGNLGDQVLTIPMLEAIHARWPEAAIDVVVNARTADVMSAIPFLDRVYPYWSREARIPELIGYRRVLDVVALYRTEMIGQRYDVAITPRWGQDPCYGNYLVYLSGAKIRCGYSASVDDGNTSMDRLLTHVARGGHHEQEAVRDLMLLSRAGLMEAAVADFDVASQPISALKEVANAESDKPGWTQLGLATTRYVVIAPGATNPRRVWPIQNLDSLMERLEQRGETKFVLIGSPDEASDCENLVQRAPQRRISLAGKTTLLQLVALIANAVLFIGNDSGPAHIAGGLGVPTVVISPFPLSCNLEHHNSPERFRPCGPQVSVVRPAEPLAPCVEACEMNEAHCIQQVSVEQVLGAIDTLIPAANLPQKSVR